MRTHWWAARPSGRWRPSCNACWPGIRSIRAKVYKDSSWLDGNESIVLDYSRASLVAHWVRDEIRSIGPGTYLGIVYLGRARVLKFVLEFPVC